MTATVAGAFDLPLRLRFRGVTARSGLLVHGPAGWGEFSPFPEYGPPLTARWRAAAEEAACRPWPAPVRSAVPVNVTVPATTPERAYEVVRASGCSTAKIKVGEGDDAARVEAVRDALGPGGRIRLDVNAAWDLDEAARQIRRLAAFDLEYVEQPVPTAEDMRALRRRVDVALAADELIRLAPDPLHLDMRGVADVAVLKVQPLGGVERALAVAEALGLPAVVSSAVESSVGLAAGLALAAALPELPYACGLGTALLLEGDVVADPLLPVGGCLDVRRPAVDPVALARWAAGTGRTAELEAAWAAAGAAR
ncbi:MAG TPA: o-succinylbenzoate synthase [Actinomycetota bacterium]|nr:o-succinylbenzoate synthase [Actinomycetota bacterium]